MFYDPQIISENLFNVLFNVGVFTSKLGSNSPWVIAGNGFTNDPKVTQIYEKRLGMCKGKFQSLICIMVLFIQDFMTLSKTTPKPQFRPLGKMHQIFSQCNKNE